MSGFRVSTTELQTGLRALILRLESKEWLPYPAECRTALNNNRYRNGSAQSVATLQSRTGNKM